MRCHFRVGLGGYFSLGMDGRRLSHFNSDGEASIATANWVQWIEEFLSFSDLKGIFDSAGDASQNKHAQRKARCFKCKGKNHFKSMRRVKVQQVNPCPQRKEMRRFKRLVR